MNEQTKVRIAPKPDTYVKTEDFWEAAADGILKLQYCEDTGRFQHPPKPVSMYTGSRNLSWKPVSGEGVIYTFTTIRIPGPGLEGRIPLTAATVELSEGVRMIANVMVDNPDQLSIGAAVNLVWEEIAPGVQYPCFRLK